MLLVTSCFAPEIGLSRILQKPMQACSFQDLRSKSVGKLNILVKMLLKTQSRFSG